MIAFLLRFFATVLKLNRLLGTRFVPDHPSSKSPLGASLAGVLNHHNSGNLRHRDFELQKLQFLVQNLQQLEKSQPNLLQHYSKNLRQAGSTDSFFGTRFEINIASSLLMKGVALNKCERPDFLIKNSNVGIECTSARLRIAQTKKDLSYKIGASIYKKASKGYASRSIALFIDNTNLAHNTKPFDSEPFRRAATANEDKSPFGAILLFFYLMNEDKGRIETPYLRIDHAQIGADLLLAKSRRLIGTSRAVLHREGKATGPEATRRLSTFF